MNQLKRNKRVVLLCTLLILSQNLFALPSDRKKPAYINSDKAKIDFKKNVSIFTGKAKLDQGTTHIWGHQITAYTDSKRELRLAIATGSPAHYSTIPDTTHGKVYGTAERIEYYPNKQLVYLIGHAVANNRGNVYKGAKLKYNIATQVINSEASKQERTTFVIQPDTLNGTTSSKKK